MLSNSNIKEKQISIINYKGNIINMKKIKMWLITRKYITPGKAAMKEIVKHKIEVCGSENRY